MRYADLQARNLPIGSGVVEAAWKTLVSQRLKRAGMRWRTEGGQAILTFRALCQSARFARAWPLVGAAVSTLRELTAEGHCLQQASVTNVLSV